MSSCNVNDPDGKKELSESIENFSSDVSTDSEGEPAAIVPTLNRPSQNEVFETIKILDNYVIDRIFFKCEEIEKAEKALDAAKRCEECSEDYQYRLNRLIQDTIHHLLEFLKLLNVIEFDEQTEFFSEHRSEDERVEKQLSDLKKHLVFLPDVLMTKLKMDLHKIEDGLKTPTNISLNELGERRISSEIFLDCNRLIEMLSELNDDEISTPTTPQEDHWCPVGIH